MDKISELVEGKKRSKDEIHEIFMKEIKKSRLNDTDYIFINIIYKPKNKTQQETRCMFYKFKDSKQESFKALLYDKLDSSLSGEPIRASNNRILVEDQEDMYGAILKHAYNTEDKEMKVYLISDYPYSDQVHDDISK